MYQHFQILGEQVRQYRRFNAAGTQITIRLNHPPDTEPDPVAYFLASVEELFEYALANVADGDMVGVSIRNEDNQNDKTVRISFCRKDQISRDVIWSVFEKVTQSNARFNAIDRLVVDVHSVKMPVGFGGLKTKGRPLAELAHLKRSIVKVKAEQNCLAHALVIAIAKHTNDRNYKAYRQGRKSILPVVQHLLETTGINLTNDGGSPSSRGFRTILQNTASCTRACDVTR
jgi:hypothetical protein